MSDGYKVGRGRPPTHSQFPKGKSGNPRGRPPTPREGLVPSRLRRDVLRVMELPVKMKMPDGERTLTVREAVIYSLAKRAIAGEKVSFVRDWLKLQREAVEDNVKAHPELLNIRLFDMLAREQPDEPAFIESLKALIRKSKGL